MDGGYLHGKQLLSLEEVVEISLGVHEVGGASVGVDGREVVLPLFVPHVHGAVVGEEHGVAAVSGGHHAVEHVNPALYSLKYVLGGAHSHKIARLVLRQNAVDHLNHVVHHVGGLAHGKTADGVAVGTLVGDELGGVGAQVLVGAALYDGEEALAVTVERLCLVESLDAAVEPALCHFKAALGILAVALSRRALVERHDDVGSDDALSVHHVLGSEDVLRAVDVAAELTAFLAQLAYACEREHLKAA